jgi:hypothetical protein
MIVFAVLIFEPPLNLFCFSDRTLAQPVLNTLYYMEDTLDFRGHAHIYLFILINYPLNRPRRPVGL